LILIAVFLFFQSSFEGLMNNWTTTYLADHVLLSQEEALFGLSLFVAGMVIMRLLTGTILRNVQVERLIIASFALVIIALVCIKSEISVSVALTGFMLTGAGLAGGFPIMLGFVGARYEKLSGTAFSFVLTVALIGNMVINYLMGVISGRTGISHLLTIIFLETIIMIMLCLLILKKYKD
jgi:fucose permease